MLILGVNDRDVGDPGVVCFESLERGKFGAIQGEYLMSAASCSGGAMVVGDYYSNVAQKAAYKDVLVPKSGSGYIISPTWTNKKIYSNNIRERHIVSDSDWLNTTNSYINEGLFWSDGSPLDQTTNNFLVFCTVGSTFNYFGVIFEVITTPVFAINGIANFKYTRTDYPNTIFDFTIAYTKG